eukprot:CAMPEP_0171311062 /NCGR_PEP_ID=MMETSP0816-20121228/21294_1 /TAXON_ID=420281 /ORGANISM="Proboscia inermis, Strain CCAP1064/1" /LENGTH=468 /DNA_ID=CAMNT_0011795589 /DNA_START=59 /DNA_END=1465 /DNA_ORIENTATION=+
MTPIMLETVDGFELQTWDPLNPTSKSQCSKSTRIYVQPHPWKKLLRLPKHNDKSPQLFYQFSLEILLLRKWRVFGNHSGTLIPSLDELVDHPADIVVVPSPFADMWVGPSEKHKEGVDWKIQTSYISVNKTKTATIAYWDRLRTRFCHGINGASEPSCPVMVTHLPVTVDTKYTKEFLQLLVLQPKYFKGRVVIGGIESNLKILKLQSKIRKFSSITRDTSTKIIPTKPLFLTVPYPTFELPDPTVIDDFHRDKLLSSYWAPSCGSKLGKKKEKNSGGVRSALEKFLYNHPNHSRRGKSRSACGLNQHAICVKGNNCTTAPLTEIENGVSDSTLHQLVATSRFCLEPGGDTPTRSHFYVAAIFGCIPVIFDGGNLNYGEQVTQWPWRTEGDQGIGLKYENFSIILKPDDVARDPSLVMQSIKKSDYAALRIGLAKAVRSLAYSNNRHTHDAFNIFEKIVCAETKRKLV